MPDVQALPQQLYRLGETAKLLALSDSALDRLIERGEIQTVRLGPRTVRVPQSSVLAFIQRAIRSCSEEEPGR